MRADRNVHRLESRMNGLDLMWTCHAPQLMMSNHWSRSNGSSGSVHKLPSSRISCSRIRVETHQTLGPNIGQSLGNWKIGIGSNGFGGASMNWTNCRSSLKDSVT